MPAPDILHRLVRRFEGHLDSYRSGKYNETPQEQAMVKGEIESTDVRIDHLVYELHGLFPEEINIVDGKE